MTRQELGNAIMARLYCDSDAASWVLEQAEQKLGLPPETLQEALVGADVPYDSIRINRRARRQTTQQIQNLQRFYREFKTDGGGAA